ncbi:hypothetical protein [Streptomyces sp. GF20]|uniref:hypothetical protein n=1 Tax=Streptomyces sp. GF20 TaxID=2692235 RepID=UPI001F3743DD|nr:hypothetical protein [Streptomyces sp. GF20]
MIPIGLLITFDRFVHNQFLKQLDAFVHDSKQILDAWNLYSDTHTDLDGWPEDPHAYGLRQSQRDSDTARAFEPLHAGARRLLTTAGIQLSVLPLSAVQSRWVYQVSILTSALDRLDNLHEQWLRTRDTLPLNSGPGTPDYDDALAEYHADAWSSLDDWATHGLALSEIAAAARTAPSPLAPAPAVAATPGKRAAAGR